MSATDPKGRGMPKRAAIYLRVSTTEQGVDSQRGPVEQLIVNRGWTQAAVYTDIGISGTRDRRPALDRLMEDARQGRFDLVVVYRSDRLFRSLKHMVNALSDLTSYGCELVSVTEPAFDSSPTGKLILTLLAVFAEFERSLAVERTRAGMVAARKRGARIGRPRKKLDADQVRKMRKEGVSLQEIARRLNLGKTTVQRFVSRISDNGPEGGSDPDTYYAPILSEISD